ncbi:MAG: zinc ABC transporter substrate-binding protein, partial [Bacteroidales bacterium]
MIRNSIILFVLVVVIGCTTDDNSDKPVITVSILPQKYLLQKIAGNSYELNVMIPPGASPAIYDPAPGQLQQLSKSDAYFMIGHLVFENVWIKKIASVNKSMQVFDLSSGIELIRDEHHHDSKEGSRINTDPHIWL